MYLFRGIECKPEQYKIPLLSLVNTGPLTISEHIGHGGTVHSVSAQVRIYYFKYEKI